MIIKPTFIRRRDFLSLPALWSGWALARRGQAIAADANQVDSASDQANQPTRANPGAGGDASTTYAESFMFDSASADGAQEVSVRLARFPPKNVGSLWVMACFG